MLAVFRNVFLSFEYTVNTTVLDASHYFIIWSQINIADFISKESLFNYVDGPDTMALIRCSSEEGNLSWQSKDFSSTEAAESIQMSLSYFP